MIEKFLIIKISTNKNTSLVPGSGINLKNYSFNSNKNYNNKFLYVGRFIKDKGIIELMEAIKFIFDNNKNIKIKFAFVGNFDENNPSSINKEKFMKFIKNYQC